MNKKIAEMNLQEIEERLAEIAKEIETRSGDELAALQKEVKELQERKAELIAMEERARVAADLNGGRILPDRVRENSRREPEKKVSYRAAFWKVMTGQELSVEERAAYSTLSNANAVVPEELQADIITRAREYAPILNEVTLLNVPGGVRFAVEGDTDEAKTHTELAVITAAKDSMIEVTLSAYEIAKLIQVSATVKNMAMPQFESWLTSQLAERIAMKLENLVFNGSGTSEAQGILTVKTTADSKTITAENIFALIGELKSGYARNAKFVMNRKTFFTKVLPLQDKAKNDLVVWDNSVYRILGFEVMWTDSLKDDVVLLGDFRKYVANLSAPQRVISQFDIDTNSYKYLGVAQFDGKVALEEAFVLIKPDAVAA